MTMGTIVRVRSGTELLSLQQRGENEIILQRGTKFRITKAEYTNGKWYIDMEVLEQSPKEIKGNGYYFDGILLQVLTQ